MGGKYNNFVGVGCLVQRNAMYLLAKQGFGEMLNKWVLPGGHLEDGESLSDGALRELYEETGIIGETNGIVAIRSKQINQTTTDVYIVFLVTEKNISQEIVVDGSEILEARFFSIDELRADTSVAWLAKEICECHEKQVQKILVSESVEDLPYKPYGFYEFYQ